METHQNKNLLEWIPLEPNWSAPLKKNGSQVGLHTQGFTAMSQEWNNVHQAFLLQETYQLTNCSCNLFHIALAYALEFCSKFHLSLTVDKVFDKHTNGRNYVTTFVLIVVRVQLVQWCQHISNHNDPFFDEWCCSEVFGVENLAHFAGHWNHLFFLVF